MVKRCRLHFEVGRGKAAVINGCKSHLGYVVAGRGTGESLFSDMCVQTEVDVLVLSG